MPIVFHAGQREVQDEANSRPAADMLGAREWATNTHAFYTTADLFIYATVDADGALRFGALSGETPLVELHDEGVLLPAAARISENATQIGAMAINLEQRRRARINGRLAREGARPLIVANEEIINCRKYIAPSVSLEDGFHAGPDTRETVGLDDAGLRNAVATAETAFLASVSPTGQPDVSHRGGPPGYLHLDAANGVLSWPELIGNGMFKSTGNVRATGTATLLALDLPSGDAYELQGRAEYRTVFRYEAPREHGLWPSNEDFPVQGELTLRIESATRLQQLILPRRRIEDATKVTSCSPREDQVPV